MDSMPLIALGLVLVVAIAAFIGMNTLTRKRSGLNHAFYQSKWQNIEAFKVQGGGGWQLAIMEADKLLDHALKARGFRGETMGDRLKSARPSFRSNDAVWQAHKLRNRLAHESDVRLNRIGVEQACQSFKNALKDLGAL